jgi:hypothetical protein
VDDEHEGGRWADWGSTVAITGIARADLAWAMSRGQVGYSLTRPGHDGVLMVRLDDVKALLQCAQSPRLRIVRDGH